MMASALHPSAGELPVLLRGEAGPLVSWIERLDAKRVLWCLLLLSAGAGLYGGSIGFIRSPLQGAYAAIKFPLIVLLTTLGNGLLNGLLAPLLGLDLRFRQSMFAVLLGFTMAAVILAAFSPVMYFVGWNLPPLNEATTSRGLAYEFFKLLHVLVIAFAGIAAHLRLAWLLQHLSGSRAAARRVVVAWLAGNLFLGSQFCWILRPFIGSPFLEVEFLRPDAFAGNFYETVFRAIQELTSTHTPP